MNIRTYSEVGEFLDRTRPLLEENEVLSNLMLGMCEGLLKTPPKPEQSVFLATVEDAASVQLMVLINGANRMILMPYQTPAEESFDTLIEYFASENKKLPGVVGPVPLADQFAAKWAAKQNQTAKININMRAFELTEVIPPSNVSGEGRFATLAELELLSKWSKAFLVDAGLHDAPTDEQIQLATTQRIEGGNLFLWYDQGQPVSMSNQSRPTVHGTCVNLVYTPLEWRGHGYASAGVAALSQHILDSGKTFATLFTDMTNPTSNKIYQNIGYHPIADFNEYDFK